MQDDKKKSHDAKSHIDFLRQKYQDNPRFWQIIILVIIALLLTRCYFNHDAENNKPHVPAVLAKVEKENVPIYFDALGTVTSTYTITVRTQINGNLWAVYFREGQMVKAGELLALIDPRPYQAQLTQYQGQYARDTALLANAKLDLSRYQKLWKQNAVAKQTLDTQTALVQQDQGIVKIDEGLIQATQVNLMYCQITSPITGRVGLRLVDPGNFVQTSDTNGIAVVNMISPITVIFTLPEDDVPQLLAQTNAGKVLTVYAYDRLANRLLATGQLLTMDNQVDPTTGTVKLKAIFTNNANTLFPNQFVNIKLLLTILPAATVVPTEAIQHTSQGSYVYVANTDSTVKMQPITTGVTMNGTTVINSGVKPGMEVVTEGADRLTDGAKIQVADGDNKPHKKWGKKHFWRSIL